MLEGYGCVGDSQIVQAPHLEHHSDVGARPPLACGHGLRISGVILDRGAIRLLGNDPRQGHSDCTEFSGIVGELARSQVVWVRRVEGHWATQVNEVRARWVGNNKAPPAIASEVSVVSVKEPSVDKIIRGSEM